MTKNQGASDSYIDMKALPDLEVKNLATTPGPRQHLAARGESRG